MRTKWFLVTSGLAGIVALGGCDDGAVVGGMDSVAGAEAPDTTGPASSSVALPPGVPEGAEVGEAADWYGGTTATYATYEADGTVKEFGAVMAMRSVANIPQGSFMTFQWLKIPASVAEQTFIKSFQFDFMPVGHPPARVYDVPHIETHAFAWTQAEIDTITCQNANDALIPEADFVPEGTWNFDPMPGVSNCTPSMGVHGIDVTAPEVNGARFTQTLTLVVARGEFLAHEPKVTIEELQNRKSFDMALPLPKRVMRQTRIPTWYRATYLPAVDAYRFAYTDFVTVEAN